MNIRREEVLDTIAAACQWDVLIIGGGATGLGSAVEAAARGYRTLLLESSDFTKGTSSRSTKLVHGGVRYLRQGNVSLVLEALRERGRMLRNAPHVAHRRLFIVPAWAWWEVPFYGIGLTIYDLLAGSEGLGRSRVLSAKSVCKQLANCKEGLKAGIAYYDGQFDDARYAISLLRTLFDLGGYALNYARVAKILKRGGQVCGALATDVESGHEYEIPAKAVINATGVFADAIRQLDEPEAAPVIAASQGTHLVLPRNFLPGESALMVPRTSDGRVLFAIPWHERVIVGTTDDPVDEPALEPRAMPDEKRFLLDHIERYLGHRPASDEILSVWSGQRPLVRHRGSSNTAALSRDHTIFISNSRLITIVGGKWTTYRKMAEDVINRAAELCGLPKVVSRTADLRLHGWTCAPEGRNEWEQVYGADLSKLHEIERELPETGELLHPKLPFRRSEIVWAARYEMAHTVEDALARRTRALFMDARASIKAAPATAQLMASELGKSSDWEREQVEQYRRVAQEYLWQDS